MATHTNIGGGEHKRRFQIGREGGEKTGAPVFLEWLRELPAESDRKGRKFETRGDATKRHYEIFTALDGILIDIYREKKTILNEERDLLYITLDDGDEIYDIEIGNIDSRYAQNLMGRLLNKHFNPAATLRISPYAMIKDDKTYIGVSAYNPDKLEPIRRDDGYEIPEPATTKFQGKTLWDFTPVAEWLFGQIEANVKPRLLADAWQAKNNAQPKPQQQETPRKPAMAADANFPGEDDLPF